jgi:hypothetical protein
VTRDCDSDNPARGERWAFPVLSYNWGHLAQLQRTQHPGVHSKSIPLSVPALHLHLCAKEAG